MSGVVMFRLRRLCGCDGLSGLDQDASQVFDESLDFRSRFVRRGCVRLVETMGVVTEVEFEGGATCGCVD